MIEERQSELLTAMQAGELTGYSAKRWRALSADGQTPAPVRVGFGTGRFRWRRTEILAWIAAGCPCRAAWEALGKRETAGQTGAHRTVEST